MKHLSSRLHIKKQKHLYISICIILLITIPILTLLFSPKSDTESKTPSLFSLPSFNQGTKAQLPNTTSTIESVKKLIDLPTDEEPLIATVTDPSLLQDQDFFQKAQKGDKVIIYKNNKFAILYRPGINKIITSAEAEFQIHQPTKPPSSSTSALTK